MSAVVYVQPPRPQPPPDALANWHRFELTWTGWDGSVWDLRDLTGGVIVTNEGLLGLHDPSWEIEASTSPATAGRRRLDARASERPLLLPVYMWNDDGTREWLELHEAFFHSFHPLKPGMLTVTTVLGSRSIECYSDSDGGFSYTRDPTFTGFSRYPVNLTAEDPWWRGEPIIRSWERVTPMPFFGSDGNLYVSSNASLENAEIENPGDVDAWVQWKVAADAGTQASGTLTVNGGALGLPTIPVGQVLEIDTDPAVGSADMNGVEVDGLMNPWDPRPVPESAGVVPLSLQISGSGTVHLRMVPRYFRGF